MIRDCHVAITNTGCGYRYSDNINDESKFTINIRTVPHILVTYKSYIYIYIYKPFHGWRFQMEQDNQLNGLWYLILTYY